jgi:DNA ligase 1
MLRQPGSLDEVGRSTTLLKGKTFTDAERASPAPLGTLVTYRDQELTDGGVPRFPTFLRVRIDP